MAHDLEKKVRTKDVLIYENADFSSLLLCDRVLSGLTKAGFKKPSPIQLQAIPTGRFGKDLLVQAKSGTGKTLVFVIVALEMLRYRLFQTQVLILVPTREIATQICSVIKTVGSSFHKLKCESFIGGLPVADDIKKATNCQIAVGTPGRIKQLIGLKALSISSIRLLVFDEADQLLEYSYYDDIEYIFNSLPEDKQVIATSATYPPKLRALVFKFLRDPHKACLVTKKLALFGVVHYAKIVERSAMPLKQYNLRLAALEPVLKTLKFTQCLVYCNGVYKCETLYRDIKKWGFSTTYISSNRDQNDRLRAIECLKRFKCKVLVSSDVTARGIDAENVDLVIHFDIAKCLETYLHRSGRAGRYGTVGVTISFVDGFELQCLARIEKGGAFKSYLLPDPLPVNLIEKPSLEKYVIEETPHEIDALVEEEENSGSFSNETEKVFASQMLEVKKDVDLIETGSECTLTNSQCRENSEEQEEFSDTAPVEVGNSSNSTSENKQPSLDDESQGRLYVNSEYFAGGNLKDSSICDSITKSSESLEVESDAAHKSKVSVNGNHDLNSMSPNQTTNSNTVCHSNTSPNTFDDLEVSNSSLPKYECIIGANENVCDTDCRVTPVECNTQNGDITFPDSNSSNPINSVNETDLQYDEIHKNIETFVDNYETNKNKESINVLSNKKNSETENCEWGIISPGFVADLNSRRSDYYCKVFKLFLEDDCNKKEGKIQENLNEAEDKVAENDDCNKKEGKIQENLNEAEHKVAENEVVIKENVFLSKENEGEHKNNQEIDDVKHICAQLECDSVKDFSSDSTSISDSESPNDESTPYFEKSKHKVSDISDVLCNISDLYDTESKSGDGSSNASSQSSSDFSDVDLESCSDNLSSPISSSLDDDSREEYNENFQARNFLNESQSTSCSSNSGRTFVCHKKNVPVNFQHTYSSRHSTNMKNQQPSYARHVNTPKKKHHSKYLNASLPQLHPSRCLKSHHSGNNCKHFPNYYHTHQNQHHSQCLNASLQQQYPSRNSKSHHSTNDCEHHSPLCYKPSEHRCHPYNDSIACNQREICAQWYHIFYNQWLHIQRHAYFNA